MTIGPGVRVDPYEVTALIGDGGMGKVWRAHHLALKRDDAQKVLPGAFASNPERLARFQREAQVLASLNHPNIAHVYGLEHANGTQALVMELVEGPTLADRLAGGAMPVEEALIIARQIAEALEAAHEQGIIHRDLKPANVKVRPDGKVKVLDFGLAKAIEPTAMSPNLSQSPTITTPAMTQLGMILGTAAYMSPEQAKGRRADKRSDIWVFGCVLFEMWSGRRAFDGEDISETLADVMRVEPAWEQLPRDLPPALIMFLKRCLRKDPKERVRDIGDVRLALDGAFETPSGGALTSRHRIQPFWRRAAPYAAAVIVASAMTVLAVRSLTPSTVSMEAAVTKFAHTPPANQRFRVGDSAAIAVAPDGSTVVFGGVEGLYGRAMNDLEARLIPGTEGGVMPFFFARQPVDCLAERVVIAIMYISMYT